MPWTDVSFTFASTLTAAQLNQIQANFAAMAAGETGAPDIDAAAVFGDGSITPDKLETNHVTVTLSGSASPELAVTTAFHIYPHSAISGTWGTDPVNFWPTSVQHISGSENIRSGWHCPIDLYANTASRSTSSGVFGGPTLRARLGIISLNGTHSGGHIFKMRAVEASPPYYLGDELIPGFVFMALDDMFDVTYYSLSPPWAVEAKRRKKNLGDCSLEEFLASDFEDAVDLLPHPFETENVVNLVRPDDKILRLFEDSEGNDIWVDIMRKFKPVPCRHIEMKGCPKGVSMCGISFERRK